jgi:hypothetical protein
VSSLDALPLEVRARISTGCWTWTGPCSGGRYGAATVDGRHVVTHRYVYELLVGPIPDGLEIDHTCQNIRCCNPEHLEPVTHQENIRRANARKPARTHCSLGHELTPENTYTYSYGRVCKVCALEKHRRRREQMKADGRVQNRPCPAITQQGPRKGSQCGRPALIGGTLCHAHDPAHADRRAARAEKSQATIQRRMADWTSS